MQRVPLFPIPSGQPSPSYLWELQRATSFTSTGYQALISAVITQPANKLCRGFTLRKRFTRESTSLRHADSRGCGSVPFPSISDLRHSIAVYVRSFQGKPARARAGSSPKSRGSPLYDLGYVLIFSCEGERRVSPTLQGKYTICRHRNSSSSIGHACIACPREREDAFPRLGAAGRDIVIEQSLVIETAELAFLPFLLLVARLARCAPQLASLRAPAV